MARKTETFETGTAIKISTLLGSGPATSAKITIYNPSDIKVIEDVSMNEESDRVWGYIWQTDDDSHISGTYKAVITVEEGGYTSVEVQYFELKDEDTPYN